MKTTTAVRVLLPLLLILMTVSAMLVPSPASAAASKDALGELEARLEQATANRAKAQKELAEAKSGRADALATKKAIDKQIYELSGELDALEQLITGLNLQIGEKDKEITAGQERVDNLYQIVRERIRLNREDGNLDFLEMLFESDGMTDFFTSLDRFACMLDYDTRLMKEYTDTVKAVSDKRASLMENKENLKAREADLKKREAELEESLDEANALLKSADADLASAEKRYEKLEELETQVNKEREEMLAELSQKTGQKYVGGEFLWPLPDPYTKVSCGFGPRIHPVTGKYQHHNGIDIPAAYGTPIYAVNDGTVIEVSSNYADGYYVTISHGGGVASFYSHLSRWSVKVGDKVKRGQVIARVGSSGYTTGAHLNLNIYVNSTAVDPMPYFD